MRVFCDEYKDCALLAFDKVVVNPTLQVSVRSLLLRRGAYLGPQGSFQARPYYFTLERIVTEYGARFRAGPDMAAHMREFDRVEVRSDDEWLCEEGAWDTAGGDLPGSVAQITRTHVATWTESAAGSDKVHHNEDFVQALASAVAHPKPEHEREYVTAEAGAAYYVPDYDSEPAHTAERQAKPPRGASGATMRWLAVGFTMFAIAGAGLLVAPGIRCALTGACDTAAFYDEQRLERAGATVAQNCAKGKSQVGDYCAVDECIAPYRAQFPAGPAIDQLNRIAVTASTECDNARQRQQRADAQKPQASLVLAAQTQVEPHPLPSVLEQTETKEADLLFSAAQQCANANPCLASPCYAEVRKRFATGERAGEVTAELESASQLCGPSPNAVLPDGVYSGRALAGCGAPQQFGIPVKIQGGDISWQHDAAPTQGEAPVAVLWSGTIDREGNIRAVAQNAAKFQASGRYHGDEREITMQYPGCVAMLSISGRVK